MTDILNYALSLSFSSNRSYNWDSCTLPIQILIGSGTCSYSSYQQPTKYNALTKRPTNNYGHSNQHSVCKKNPKSSHSQKYIIDAPIVKNFQRWWLKYNEDGEFFCITVNLWWETACSINTWEEGGK